MNKLIKYIVPELLAITIVSVSLIGFGPVGKAVQKNYSDINLGKKTCLISKGRYSVTAYCPCSKCCGKSDGITSIGTKATAGHTIAVDPDVIPYGTEIIIDGIKYTAEDCGGKVKGKKLDIFFDSHEEAVDYGVQTKEIFVEGELWYER